MRAIEAWLAETGWGSNDALISTDINSEESSESSDDSKDSRSDKNSEEEVPEGDTVSNSTVDSDKEHGTEVDPDAEYASSENNEETVDGEYGFSSL